MAKPALFTVVADEYAINEDPYLKAGIPYTLSVGRRALTFTPKSCFACAKAHTVMLTAVADCKKIVNLPQKLGLGIEVDSYMHKLWVEGGNDDLTKLCYSKIQSMRHFLINGEVLVAGWIDPVKKDVQFYEKATALRLFAAMNKLVTAGTGTEAKPEVINDVEGQTMVKLVKKKYGVMLTTEQAQPEGEPLVCSVFVEKIDSSVLTLSIHEGTKDGVPQFGLRDMDLQAADVSLAPLIMELSADKILDSPPVSGMTVPKAQRPRTVSGTGGRASMFGGKTSKPKAEKAEEGEKAEGEPAAPKEGGGGIMGKIKRGTSIATKKTEKAEAPAADEVAPTEAAKA